MFWNYLYDESLIMEIFIVLFLDMPFEEISKLEEINNGEFVGADFKVCFYILKSLQQHQKITANAEIFPIGFCWGI